MIIIGLGIGSFLNICICYMTEGQSISFQKSHCRWYKRAVGLLDLVPVLGYLYLGGKYRYCKEKVSGQYMLIGLLNGLLYGITIYRFDLTVKGVLACLLISFMIVLTFIDIKYMLLPTDIILTGVCVALVIRGIGSYIEGEMNFFLQGIWGGIIGYGIMALLFFICMYLLKREGMGYGDVRYMGMIGIFTSWQAVLLTLFIGSFIGSIYGIIQLSVRRKSETFPFGPFMSLGALVSIFYGVRFTQWYMNM